MVQGIGKKYSGILRNRQYRLVYGFEQHQNQMQLRLCNGHRIQVHQGCLRLLPEFGCYRAGPGYRRFQEKRLLVCGILEVLSEFWVFQEKVDMKVSAFSFTTSLLVFGYL